MMCSRAVSGQVDLAKRLVVAKTKDVEERVERVDVGGERVDVGRKDVGGEKVNVGERVDVGEKVDVGRRKDVERT